MGAAAPPAGSAEPSADRQSLQRGDHGWRRKSSVVLRRGLRECLGRTGEGGLPSDRQNQGKLIGWSESGEELLSAKRKAWDEVKGDGRPLAGLTAQAAEFQQTRRADAIWRNEAFSEMTLPGLLMVKESGAAIEAEDISRAVQQDARRYDGGFTMF